MEGSENFTIYRLPLFLRAETFWFEKNPFALVNTSTASSTGLHYSVLAKCIPYCFIYWRPCITIRVLWAYGRMFFKRSDFEMVIKLMENSRNSKVRTVDSNASMLLILFPVMRFNFFLIKLSYSLSFLFKKYALLFELSWKGLFFSY